MINVSLFGILQTRILEWVAFPFSRVSSQSRDQTQVSCIADSLPAEDTNLRKHYNIKQQCKNHDYFCTKDTAGLPPMAQQVKNLPAMQETQLWALGQEDPWRRAWQPAPVFLLGKSHGQRRLLGPMGPEGSDVTWATEPKGYSKKWRYFGETSLILLERNMNFGNPKIKENILTLSLTLKRQI